MTDTGQSSKFVVPLHGHERPFYSYFIWTILIAGICIETSLHVFIAEPAGIQFGLTAEILSLGRNDKGKYGIDQLDRKLEYARLPFFLNQNQAKGKANYDQTSRVHDDTSSYWENPFAKNTRSGLVPLCNKAWTFPDYMEDKVSTIFEENYMNTPEYSQIWTDMPRLDLIFADGMVGLNNVNKPDSEKIWHFWLDIRKCIVNGLTPYPMLNGVSNSTNVDILRDHNLINQDILPAKRYSTFKNIIPELYIQQEHSFIWDYDLGIDITNDVLYDRRSPEKFLECYDVPYTPGQHFNGPQNMTLGKTCSPSNSTAECTCKYKRQYTDYIKKIDDLQILLNKNTRNMAVTYSQKWQVLFIKDKAKYIITFILPILLQMSGLYFPSGHWFVAQVCKNLLRLLALYNISDIYTNYLSEINNQFTPICWTGVAHASSEGSSYDPFRSMNCEFSDGMKFIGWRVFLNLLYLIASFMWRSDHTRQAAYSKDFKSTRVGFMQNKRGLSATNPVSVFFAFILFSNIFVTNTTDLLQYFSTASIIKSKWTSGGMIPLLWHLMNKQDYDLGQGVFGMILVYFAAYLPTRVKGSVNNKPHNTQLNRPRLIMFSLLLIIPFPQIVKGLIGVEKLGAIIGHDMAIVFLWFLQVPRYAVYFMSLTTIGSQIATDAYWIFQVLKYALYLILGILVATAALWSVNCNFNYATHKLENYAATAFSSNDFELSSAQLEGLRLHRRISDLCPRSILDDGLFNKLITNEWPGGAKVMQDFYACGKNDDHGVDRDGKCAQNATEYTVLFRHIMNTDGGIDGDDKENITYVEETRHEWPSTYLSNSLFSLFYSVVSAASSAGGDISPSSVNEKILCCIIFLTSVFLIQTKLTYVFSTTIMSTFIEKNMFVKNAASCIFIQRTNANKHRIDHTVSLLWRHWELWRGMNPHTYESDDLEVLPRPVRQELNFFILEELLKRNKSIIMSQLAPAKLKQLAEHIEYHVVHANDVVLGSLKVQEFVLLVKSGQLMITDNDNDEHKADIDVDCVYFEKECFLRSPVNYTIRCFSDYSEFYTIPRKAFCEVVRTAKNLDAIIDRLNLTPAQMKIVEHHLDAEDKELNSVHVVCQDPPAMLKGDILTKPMLAKHNRLNIDYYSDLKNYRFKTPRFVHNFESVLSFNNMTTEFIELKYEADCLMKILTSAKYEAYHRNLADKLDELVKLEQIQQSEEANCYDMRGPVTEFNRYLKDVKQAISEEKQGSTYGVGEEDKFQHVANESKTLWDGDDIDLVGGQLANKRMSVGADAQANAADLAALALKKKQALEARLQKEKEEEEQAEDVQEYFLQITPGSTFLLYWQRFNAVHALGAFIFTTMYWSYLDPSSKNSGSWGGDVGGFTWIQFNIMMVEIVAYIDAVVYLYTGFNDETNTIVFNPKTRFNQMTYSDRMVRFIGVFPVWILATVLPTYFVSQGFLTYYLSARMLKVLYYYKIPNNQLEQDAVKLYSPLTSVLMSTLIQCFFVMQMICCAVYKLACNASSEQKEQFILNGECEPGTWAWQTFYENKKNTDELMPMEQWWITFLWMIKQFFAYSTVGITVNRHISRVLISFVLLMGVFLMAKIVAVVSAFFELSIQEGQKAEQKAHLQLVLDMIKDAPKILQDKVIKTKNQVFNRYNGFALPGFFEIEDCLLPVDKLLIKYESMNPILDQIPFFSGLPSNIAHKLSMHAKTFQYCKDQVIIHEKEIVPYLFYITHGTIEVRKNGQTIGFLEASYTFNTLNMAGEVPSKFEYVAHTGCEIVEWNRSDIQSACGDGVWNIFTEDFVKKAKASANSQNIAVRTINFRVLEDSCVQHANESMKAHNFQDSEVNENNDGLIDPRSDYWLNYQKWNTVRIFFHLIIAFMVSSIFYDQWNIHGWVWKGGLIIFDLAAMYGMTKTMKVIRLNPETQMNCNKASFSRKFYFKHGLIYDAVSCILPPLLDGITQFDSGLSFFLRLMQILHASRYFKYVYKSSPKSIASVIQAVYFLIVMVCGASVVGVRLSRFERDDSFSSKFDVFKLNTLSKFANDYLKWKNYNQEFDQITIQKGDQNMTVNSGSWLAQFQAKADDNVFFDMDNPYHWIAMCWYYWMNVVTATAGSGVNPMKFSFATIFEMVVQFGGLMLCVYLCVEFKNYGTSNDQRRMQATSQFHSLKLFFKNTVGIDSDDIKRKVLSQFNWNHSIHSNHVEKQIYNGLNLACQKDLAYNRYGSIIEVAYVKNNDIDLQHLEARDLSVHCNKLAVTKGTTLIYKGQLTDDVFFLAKGGFECDGDELSAGTYIVPENGSSKATVTCTESGYCYVVPKEKFDCHHQRWQSTAVPSGVHQPATKVDQSEAIHFKCPAWLSFVGMLSCILSFMIGGLSWVVLGVDSLIFLMVIGWMHKSRGNDLSWDKMNLEEKLVLIGSIPMFGQVRFVLRAVFFFIENNFCYVRVFEDLDIEVYHYRLTKFTFYIISICSFGAGLFVRNICPGGVCDTNSMIKNTNLRDDLGQFNYLETETTLKQQFDLFVSLFYASFDNLASAGFGNMGPEMISNIFIVGLICLIGRINEAALLGLGNDILGHEIDGLTSNYLSIRNRIRTYMREMGCEAKRYGYICGFIDSLFAKTNYFDVKDCLDSTAIVPGLRRDFYFELFGASLRKISLFNSLSDSQLAEVCERACAIEHYFAGNIVQEADTDFLGIIVLMSGSVTIDDESVAIEGDCIFDDIASRNPSLAPKQVKCFSESQIVRVDYEKAREIMNKLR